MDGLWQQQLVAQWLASQSPFVGAPPPEALILQVPQFAARPAVQPPPQYAAFHPQLQPQPAFHHQPPPAPAVAHRAHDDEEDYYDEDEDYEEEREDEDEESGAARLSRLSAVTDALREQLAAALLEARGSGVGMEAVLAAFSAASPEPPPDTARGFQHQGESDTVHLPSKRHPLLVLGGPTSSGWAARGTSPLRVADEKQTQTTPPVSPASPAPAAPGSAAAPQQAPLRQFCPPAAASSSSSRDSPLIWEITDDDQLHDPPPPRQGGSGGGKAARPAKSLRGIEAIAASLMEQKAAAPSPAPAPAAGEAASLSLPALLLTSPPAPTPGLLLDLSAPGAAPGRRAARSRGKARPSRSLPPAAPAAAVDLRRRQPEPAGAGDAAPVVTSARADSSSATDLPESPQASRGAAEDAPAAPTEADSTSDPATAAAPAEEAEVGALLEGLVSAVVALQLGAEPAADRCLARAFSRLDVGPPEQERPGPAAAAPPPEAASPSPADANDPPAAPAEAPPTAPEAAEDGGRRQQRAAGVCAAVQTPTSLLSADASTSDACPDTDIFRQPFAAPEGVPNLSFRAADSLRGAHCLDNDLSQSDSDDLLLRPPFRPAPRTAPPDDADQVVPASPRPARDATVPFCYGGRLPASIYYATGTRVTRPQCAAGLVLPDILNDVAGASPSPPAPDAESESEPDVETDAEAPELGVGRDVVTGILYDIVRQSTGGQSSHQSPTEDDTAMEAEELAETEEQPTEPEDRRTDPEDRPAEPEEQPTGPEERPSEPEEGGQAEAEEGPVEAEAAAVEGPVEAEAEAEEGPAEAEMEDPVPLSPSLATGAEGASAVPEEEPVSVIPSEKEDREQETKTETEEGAAQNNAEEVVRGVAEEDSTGAEVPDAVPEGENAASRSPRPREEAERSPRDSPVETAAPTSAGEESTLTAESGETGDRGDSEMDVRKEGDSLRCSVPLEKVPQFDAAAVVQAADADKSELKKFQFRMEPTHRTPKGFLCEVCSTVYKRSFSLKRHYLRCHVSVCYLSERDVANCGIANPSKAGAPLSYAKAPGNVECPGMYRCHTCGDWFDDRLTGLRPHLLDHPQPTAAPPTDTGKGTNSKLDTNGACTGAEAQGDLSSAATVPSGVDVAVQPKVEIVPRFLCLYCDKRFVTGPLCRRHQRRVHIARENAVRQKLSAAATPAASEANASKGAVANKGAAAGKEPVAGKEVATSKEVPASKEAAAGETKPGGGAEAPDETATPAAKKEARPRQPRPHQCPYCAGGGTVFKELAALVRHYRRRHADRYHVCAPCATRFPTRDELEAHGVEKHGRRPRSFRAEARAAAKAVSSSAGDSDYQTAGSSSSAPGASCQKQKKIKKLPVSVFTTTTRYGSGRSMTEQSSARAVEVELAFFSRVSDNIRYNLLHHLDGKLECSAADRDVKCVKTAADERRESAVDVGSACGEGCPESANSGANTGKIDTPVLALPTVRKAPTSFYLSRLDISTQLAMGRSMERPPAPSPPRSPSPDDVPLAGRLARSRAARDRVAADVDFHAGLNLVRNAAGCSLSVEPLDTRTVNEDTASVGETAAHPLSASAPPTPTEKVCGGGGARVLRRSVSERVVAEETRASAASPLSPEDGRGLVLSGEWVRPRSYVCIACSRTFPDLCELEEHHVAAHPNVICTHFELEGQSEVADGPSSAGLTAYDLCRRHLGAHCAYDLRVSGTGPDKPEEGVRTRADAHKEAAEKKGTSTGTPPEPEPRCTKCGRTSFFAHPEFHRHILECGGDTMWLSSPGGTGASGGGNGGRRRRKWRTFGSRRRRGGGGAGRGGYRRSAPATPTQSGAGVGHRGSSHSGSGRHFLSGHHHRNRHNRHLQHQHHRHLHRKAGDGDTIRRMLANLPAKRSTRRMIQFDDIRTRTRTNILMQAHLNRYKHLNRRIVTNASCSYGLRVGIQTPPSVPLPSPPPPQPAAKEERRRPANVARGQQPPASALWEAARSGSPLARSTTPAGRRSRSLLLQDAGAPNVHRRRSSLPPPERPETPSRNTRQALQKASSEKVPLPLLDSNQQGPTTRNRSFPGPPPLPPPAVPELVTPQTGTSRPQTPRPKTPVSSAQPVTTRAQTPGPASPVQLTKLRTPVKMSAPKSTPADSEVPRTQSPSPRRGNRPKSAPVPDPRPQKSTADLPHVPVLRSRASRLSLDLGRRDAAAHSVGTPPSSPAKVKKSVPPKGRVAPESESEEENETKLHQTRSRAKQQTGVPECGSHSTDILQAGNTVSATKGTETMTRGSVVETVDPEIHKTDKKTEYAASDRDTEPLVQASKQKVQKGKSNKKGHGESNGVPPVSSVVAPAVVKSEDAKPTKGNRNRSSGRASDNGTVTNKKGHGESNDGLPAISAVAPDVKIEDVKSTKGNRSRSSGRAPDNVTLTPEEGGADVKTVPKVESSPNRKKNRTPSKGKVTSTTVSTSNSSRMSSAPEGSECDSGNVKTRQGVELEALQCIKTEPVDDVTVEDLTRLVTAEKQSPDRKVSKSKKPLGETKVVKSLAESVSDVEVSSRVIAPATKHGGSSRKKESSRPKSLVSKKENVSVSDTETRVAVVVKCVKNNSKSKKPQLLEKIENAKVDILAEVESLPSENIVLSVDEDTVNDDDDDDADADDDGSSESDDDDTDSEDDDSEEGELIGRTRSERNPDGTRMFTVTHRLRAMPIIRFKPKSIKKVSKKNVQESPANLKVEAVQSSTPTRKTPDTPASGKASGAKKVKSKVKTPSAEGPGVSEISGNSDSAGCQEGSEPAASGGDAPAPPASAKSPPKKRKSTPKTKSAKEVETKGNTVGEADVDLTPTKRREPEVLDSDVVPDDLARYEPIVLSESEREHHLGGKGEAEQKLSKISDRTRQKIGRLSSPEGSTDWRLSVDSVSILLPEMDSNADLKVLESKNQKTLLDSSVPTTLGEVSVTAESSVTTPKLKGVKLSKKKKPGRQKSLLDSPVVATAELGSRSVLLPYPLDSATGDSERKEKDEVVTDAIVKAFPTESKALNQKKTTSVTNSPIKRDPLKTTLEGIDGDKKSTSIFCDTVQKAPTAEVKIVQRKRTSSLTDLTAEIDTPLSATGGVVECNVNETGHKEISENNRKKQQNKTITKQKRSASATAVVEKLEPRTSTSVSVERVVTVADVTDLIADGSGKSPSKSKLKRRRAASASKASESQTAPTDDTVKVVDGSIGAIAKSLPDTFNTSKQKKTSSTENLTERSDTGAPVVSDLLEQNSQIFPGSPAVDFSEKIVPSKPKTSKRKRNSSVTKPVPTSELVADDIDSEVIHSVKEDTTEHSTNERTPNGIDSVKEDVGTLPENSGHKSASVKMSATSDSMLSLADSGKENTDVTGEAINIAAKSMPSTSKKRRNASSARKSRRSTSAEVPVPECGATVADAAMCASTENEEFLEPRTQSSEVSVSDSESGGKEHGKLEVSTLTTVIPNGSPVSADEVHSEKGLILAAMKVAMMGAEVRPSATVDDSENVYGSSGGGKTARTGTGRGTTQSEAGGRNLCDDRRKVCRQCGRDFTSNSSFWKHIQRHCTSPCRVTLAPVSCSDVGGPLQVESGRTGRVNDVSNSAEEVRIAVGDSGVGICTVVADIAKDCEGVAEVKNTEDGKVNNSGDIGLDGEDANIFVPESVDVSEASSTGVTTEGERVESTHVKEVNDEAPETYEVSAERPDSRVSEDADEMPLARLLTGERVVSPEVCNLQENKGKSDYRPCSVTSEDAEKALSVAYRVEAGGRICLTISSGAVTGKTSDDTVSSVATDVTADVSQGVPSDESLSSSEDKDSGTKEPGSTEECETVEESSEQDLSDTSKSDGVGDFNGAITRAEIGEEDLPGRPKVGSVDDSDGVVTREDDLPGSSKRDSVSDSVVTQSVSSATSVVASEGDRWRSLADVTEAALGRTEREEVEAADGSVEKAADEEPPPDGNVSSDCFKDADRGNSNLDPVIESPEQTAVASLKRKNKKQERQHWAAASISLQTNSNAPAVTADPEPLKKSSKKSVNGRKAEHARQASQGSEGSGSGTSEGEEDVPLSSLLRTVKESRKVGYEESTEVRQENVEGQLNVSTVVSCTPDVTRGRLPRSGGECAAAAEEACHTSSLTEVEKCATESGGITVDSAEDHEEVATVCSVEKSSKEVVDVVSTDVIRDFQIPSEANEVYRTSSESSSSKRKRASEEDKDDCLITDTVAAAIYTVGGDEANSVADIQPFKVARKDVPIDSTCPEDENTESSILVNENAQLGLAGNVERPASYDGSSEFEEGTCIEVSAAVRLSDEVTSRRVDTPEVGAEYANVPEVTTELARTSLARVTAEQNSGEVAVLSHGSFECAEPADTLQISDDQSVVDLTPEEIQNLLPPLHTGPKMDSVKFGNTPLDSEDLTACFNAPSETLPDPEFLFADLPVPVHSSNTCDGSVQPEVNVDGIPTVDGPEAAAQLPITDRLQPDFSISIPECGDTSVGSGEENAEDILIGGLLPHGEEEVSEVNVNIAGGLSVKEVEPPAKGEGQYGDEEERTSEKNDEQFVYHSECAAVEVALVNVTKREKIVTTCSAELDISDPRDYRDRKRKL
ncbi:uncharacterized protein LOC126108838 [Schistocerca cancellata]|uniref:uncharacterized protein LOC126108838 n=1 Tax=Schistocerca cancellata TaxID=274614 RepID=UPI0021192B8B|nr:uncharacterized protein LOC126108838 [Schistocerca cancellata]